MAKQELERLCQTKSTLTMSFFYSANPSEKEYFKTSFHKHVVVGVLIVFFPSSGSNMQIVWFPSTSANLPSPNLLLTDSLSINSTLVSSSIYSPLKIILIKKHEQSFIKAFLYVLIGCPLYLNRCLSSTYHFKFPKCSYLLLSFTNWFSMFWSICTA